MLPRAPLLDRDAGGIGGTGILMNVVAAVVNNTGSVTGGAGAEDGAANGAISTAGENAGVGGIGISSATGIGTLTNSSGAPITGGKG